MIFSLFAASSLAFAQQTVIFDWGKVMANPDRKGVVAFLCESLQMDEAGFEQANLQFKQKRMAGKDIDDVNFWVHFAAERGIPLQKDWPEKYRAVALECLHADANMYALVFELKAKGIPVGLLSNIQERYGKLVRDLGLYEPFDPCILSFEIGVEKPDPKAYRILLATLHLPGKEVVFFDDKWENIEAARILGIDAILFQSPEQVRQDLIERGLLDD